MSVLHLIERSRKDRGARSFFFEQRKQVALSLTGDVVQRAEGARRKQRVARAPKDAGFLLMCFGEPLDKPGFSDSRLAADKHKAALARGYIVEYGLQFNQELFALK